MSLLRFARSFHASLRYRSDFSHVVIGGGIVGMAVGSELQKVPGNNVLLVEKNEAPGMETTSRNSEVIHAGIYYPKDSLKAQLCIRGKQLIYDAFGANSTSSIQVPVIKCGKFVVAQDEAEEEYLHKVHGNAQELGVETFFVPQKSFAENYPNLQAAQAVLESPTTGIISVHDYVLYHQTQLENNDGTLALNNEVVSISYNQSVPNYSITLTDTDSKEQFEITTDNIVNSAGLYAPHISNLLLPPDRHTQGHFGKGTYFTYQPKSPSSRKITDKLVYPCPNPNASSLGTHLTLDIAGQLKFGPDLEWLAIENADDIDYSPSDRNLDAAFKAVKRYFPQIQPGELVPSYTGVRPKLLSAEDNKKQFADFLIREEPEFKGFVNLLGIESPGVTAAWAIGEYVKKIYHG